MGAAGSPSHKPAPPDLLRSHPHRTTPHRLGQLLSIGAPHQVHTYLLLSYARPPTETFHCRIAHRLRDIQTLPYVVVANPHLAHVYELYLRAFERFRRIPEIRSLEDCENYCKVLEDTLKEHATVIPRLAIGVLEVRGLMKPEEIDKFMNTMLRSVRRR